MEESSDVTATEDGLIRRLTINSPRAGDSGKYTCDAVDDKVEFTVNISGKDIYNVESIQNVHGNEISL